MKDSCAGAKFSSSVLPPEMFYEIKAGTDDAAKLKEYWKDECEELKAKVEPKEDNKERMYAVKAFRVERSAAGEGAGAKTK